MDTPSLDHFTWMTAALDLATQAAAQGEIPVGAIIVHHPLPPPGATPTPPKIIGSGFNRREADNDPSAHAEIVAMRQAGQFLNTWRLVDCTLYVTLEPCPMCAGAMVQARLQRLVYGCTDPKAGSVHTLYQLCTDPRFNHRLEVIPNILSEESAALLRQFFAARRNLRQPPA